MNRSLAFYPGFGRDDEPPRYVTARVYVADDSLHKSALVCVDIRRIDSKDSLEKLLADYWSGQILPSVTQIGMVAYSDFVARVTGHVLTTFSGKVGYSAFERQTLNKPVLINRLHEHLLNFYTPAEHETNSNT